MLSLPGAVRIYIADAPTDMRKGIDGLMAVVANDWRTDVYSGDLFVFWGRRKDRIKVLLWDHGFLLLTKRLETGRFHIPAPVPGGARVEVTGVQLSMLLDGLDLGGVKEPPRWIPPRPAAAPQRGVDKGRGT